MKPLNGLASFSYKFLELIAVDAIVNGVGKLVVFISGQARKLQTGNTGFYIFAMVIGILVILALNLFNK